MSEDRPDARAWREEMLMRCRAIEQWPSWRRYADPKLQADDRKAFRAKWNGFMESGWERLLNEEPETARIVARRLMEILPVHPAAVEVSGLVARIADIESLAEDRHVLASLLMMEKHGQAVLAAGWAYRPAPRVPRRGTRFEDLFLLLGYAAAMEPPDED